MKIYKQNSHISYFVILSMLFVVLLQSTRLQAVTGRNPTGVNVNANGVSTVLITFFNLGDNEIPVDAFWCGDVTATGVIVGTNPCVSGTLLGHLPRQFDLSTINSASVANRNLTDVMSIPSAVIRRAYQEAERGASSEFFYVRQFVNNGVTTYVTVTCRMGGGGARTPLALTRVDLDFIDSSSRRSITLVKQSSEVPAFSAQMKFNGSGLLKGRWEVVLPGDEEPSYFDLLSEASLAPEQRKLQKRYRLLNRFQKFLSPVGQTVIKGPDPSLLPTFEKGAYRILLRIEASSNIDSISSTQVGNLETGGVAGFPMPTLRYFVGQSEQYSPPKPIQNLRLLMPLTNQIVKSDEVIFSWSRIDNPEHISSFKIEFYQRTGERKLLASSIVTTAETSYKATQFILNKLKGPIVWRVLAVDGQGNTIAISQLRNIFL